MQKFKTGKKAVKSLSAVVVALAMGTSVFAGTVFASAAGDDAATASSLTKYYTDYNSMEDAKKAAEDLTRQIVGEGASLLKNSNEALPMSGSEWVSVFGVTSDNLVGASDSAGAFSSGSTGSDETLAAALEDAGFKVNPTLKSFYANDTSSIGAEVTDFPGTVDSSTKPYNDAAFIVLSRKGGEGSDASRVTDQTVDEDDDHLALYTDDEGNTYKHYLMLTDEEEALIEYVTARFNKVIVITNTSNAMELEDLENNDKISAILHIGRPGVGGLAGMTDILTGLSPSGSLVDEWMTDFTTDPTWYNFGSNNQTGDATVGNGAGSNSYMRENGVVVGSSEDKNADGSNTYTSYDTEGYHGVDYEEGIYLGYKYYETVYTEIVNGNLSYDAETKVLTENSVSEGKSDESVEAAEKWWEENVLYPYGYSLNYTTFAFNAGGIYTDEGCKSALASTGLADLFSSSEGNEAEVKTVYVPVTVTNTGDVAGKKTVQAYVSAPYYSGFFRKCVVADFCGIFVNKVYADLGSANGLAVFAASALFLFQIYNDFAGYSEIALGSARLMGVKLSHNFERPLSSASFTEFFRRWHITLNQWFTQYVYIPLGGNRKGVLRKLLNTMIVFALCGLWHGASWNFVLWGVTAGVFVCIESLVRKPVRAFCAKRNINLQAPTVRVLRQAAVFMLSVPCCILFRAQDIGQIGLAYSRIFTDWGFGAEYLSGAFASLGLDAQNLAMLIACLAGMVLIYRLPRVEKQQSLPLGEAYARVNYNCTAAVFIYGILAVAFCWLALLAGSDVSGFAYFQF